MPDRPARMARHVGSVPMPSGDTTPIPVTTTRRRSDGRHERPNVWAAAARMSAASFGSSTARASVSAPTRPAMVASARSRRGRRRSSGTRPRSVSTFARKRSVKACRTARLTDDVRPERGEQAAVGAIVAMARRGSSARSPRAVWRAARPSTHAHGSAPSWAQASAARSSFDVKWP